VEIAPIIGIRSVTLANPAKAAPEMPFSLGVDPSARTGDDAYSASPQTPDRGLEEEDSGNEDQVSDEADSELQSADAETPPSLRINYFA
jgi:hypothetical protein